jgi:hypothetical protein
VDKFRTLNWKAIELELSLLYSSIPVLSNMKMILKTKNPSTKSLL